MPLTDEIRDELEKVRGRLMELLISLEPRGETKERSMCRSTLLRNAAYGFSSNMADGS
jgi:hypothetical protein